MITLTEDEFLQHRANYDGICLSCKTVRYGEIEPDAERRSCGYCGEKEVCGLELLFSNGEIVINYDGENDDE